MSDHDPSGDDEFIKHPWGHESNRNDDSNMGHSSPMAGYKPPAPKKHCKTMMMPAFKPEQVQSSAALAPTEEMKMVALPLTVYDIISGILEVNMEAWKKLPTSVQKLMLSEPASFRFHKFENAGMELVPDIIYNGVRIRYSDDVQLWTLYEIEK